jgi:hypothetical protein
MRHLHQVRCSDEFADIPEDYRVGERFDVDYERDEKNQPGNNPIKLFVLHYFLFKLN